MKVRIEIDTRTFVRFWLVVIGFAFAILMIYSARTALMIIGGAFFLALALNTPVSYLAKHLPGRSRVGGTALAYILVVAFLGVFLFLVVPPIIQQTAKFIETVPSIADSVTYRWQGISDLIAKYHLQPQVDAALTSLKDNAASWAANLGRNAISSIGSLVEVVATTLLILVLSFLMLVEGPMWLRRLWGMYKDTDRKEHHRELASRMYDVVTGYISGQLIVSGIGAIAAGVTVFIISWFTNVPANLALPSVAIAFTLSLIPMFGATLSGVLIALLLAFNDVTGAIVFVVFFIVYQQIENNYVSPIIQASKVELSALVVLVAVTIGLYLFGLVGAIISIPIAGSIKVLIEDYLARRKDTKPNNHKPLAKLAKKLQGDEAI